MTGRYRYETRFDAARREARLRRRTYIFTGLFLCLTIIGAPFGVIAIIVGLVEHSKSMNAIARAERDAIARSRQKQQKRQRNAAIRAFRNL